MADTSQPHSSRCPAWLREGGLYLIVSGVVTVLKYLLLLFLLLLWLLLLLLQLS